MGIDSMPAFAKIARGIRAVRYSSRLSRVKLDQSLRRAFIHIGLRRDKKKDKKKAGWFPEPA
jgi:hypothetical protein